MKTRPTRLHRLSPLTFMLLIVLAVMSAPAAVRYVNVNNSSPIPPYTTWATAATNIQDAVDVANAGDEIAVTNGVYQFGQRVWPPGTGTNRLAIAKPLNVHSVNGAGVTIIDGGGAIRCVYLATDATLTGFTLSNGLANYFGGSVATAGGGLYCESNSAAVSDCVITGNKVGYYTGPTLGALGAGVYGGTLTRCTLTLNTTALSDGGGAAYAILNNCVLSNNRGSDAGGGALQCTLNNCSVISNSAYYGGGASACTLNNCTIAHNSAARVGGGTWGCTANNCVLSDNTAWGEPDPHYYAFGGGASGGTLNNCTITGNQSGHGAGGASGATLNNCIVYFNTAANDPNFGSGTFNCTLNYCCTTPMPTNGVGNFTNAPLFVDLATGNLRLQPGSPCINAGNNSYVTNSTDLDGHPRILGGIVDVGAYEFVLPMQLFSSRLSGTNYCFSFDTESNRTYTIEYKNALTDPAWNSFPAIIGNGQMLTITNPIPGAPQRFYRLRAD